MIADAMKGNKIIGMVRLRPGFEKDYEGRPPKNLWRRLRRHDREIRAIARRTLRHPASRPDDIPQSSAKMATERKRMVSRASKRFLNC